MIFRLQSTVVTLAAILFLPSLGQTQAAGAPAQQSAPPAQAAPAELQENPAQPPIEPVTSGPYPVMSKAAEERGGQFFEMFNHSQTGQMWSSLSDGLRKHWAKEEKFAELNKRLRERMGAETSTRQVTILPYVMAPDTIYSRLSTFANVKVPVISTVYVNQRGQIDNFTVGPMQTPAEGRYAGYQDTAKLRLPFNGEWLVYQGGRTQFENAYALSDDQRFGVDFVYLKDNRMFSGRGGIGSKNEDYYCFGQPILAPADGTVAKAISGYDDNPPGKPSGDPADGNVIVISHGNGESSMINHLKQNSLKVKVGDNVKQGDVIAECGNSGVGPVPYLHYQLQKGSAVVLPAQFVDYIADGKPVASGEPIRGQFVKNAAAAAAASGSSGAMTTHPAGSPGAATAPPPASK
ncbi:MAG TPA: M23 family metallopeptidase [Candidatus Binatia bacterium]|nr:M23 family metallopeptidase [Candidatus Binatia bacterium]